MFSKHAEPLTAGRTARRVVVLAGCLAGVLAPGSAQALPKADITPSLHASTVSVGDTDKGQLVVTNSSSSPDDAALLTFSELALVPSCGSQFADPNCTVGSGPDLGVITVGDAPTGSGACSANSFAVGAPDPVNGKVTFTATPAVQLSSSGASSTCTVSFNYTVARMAKLDSSGAAGVQTDLVAFMSATLGGAQIAKVGWGPVTISKDAPELTARASPSVQVGGQISAAGTIAGTHPDGDITFRLYGPGDPGCVGDPLATSKVTINGNGTYPSTSFPAATPGTYRWKASYGGDDDNDAATSACSAPAAATVVTAAPTPPPPPPPPPLPPPAIPGGGGTTPGGGGSGAGAGAGSGAGTGAGTGAATGTGAAAVPAQRIRLDAFALSRKTFARATTSTALAATAAALPKKKTVKKTPKGTTIKYRISAPATVTILVEQITKGKRVGAKCVKSTKKLKKKKNCTRYVKAATIKRVYKSAGAKKLAFSGRAGRKVLPAGSYRMRASAAAGAGTTSVTRSASFKIVKK